MRSAALASLSGWLLAALAHSQPSGTAAADKAYFVARTNSSIWTIYLQDLASKKTESIRSNYLSGDSYIAEQLPPGTYRILNYRKYDNQVVLPKVPVHFSVFAGCTNFYGRLDLYEDGSVMPGKAVVTDDGVLDVNDLKSLGAFVKRVFEKNALCVSGEKDDFRFDWDAIRQYIEQK